VLHLAWCVTPGQVWTDPANLDWAAASLRLARAAAEVGVRRFVATGTCYEYDWPADAACIEGVTPIRAHTLYDATKAGGMSRGLLKFEERALLSKSYAASAI
jgi:nucleoside-diphosphate-sugar epimerase